MYAIVDIETTGGYAGFHRITEVAVVHHDGHTVTGVHQTLINPERDIPPYITALTGITPEMVVHAPTFREVADEILTWLEGRVFVAHNAQFDFGFLKKEFNAIGVKWDAQRLCTVRISRRLIPGLRSYSLGRLTEHLGITIDGRHRAGGDAQATAQVFEVLLRRDSTGEIGKMLRRTSRETTLPPNLERDELEKLPEATGVYYFHNVRGEIIYVGKAKNIRKRISGHFSGTAPEWNRTSIRNEIHRISFQLTGTELIALILEAQEIRKWWPRYNLAQKEKRERWGVLSYTDQAGYQRLVVNVVRKGSQPLIELETKGDAWNMVWQLVREFSLCPKLSGLEKTAGVCAEVASGSCNGACIGSEPPHQYNERLKAASDHLSGHDENLAVVDKGRKRGERSVVVVKNGRFAGFGYYAKDEPMETWDHVLQKITPSRENQMVSYLVNSWLMNAAGGTILTF